jgi:hypothetical protein
LRDNVGGPIHTAFWGNSSSGDLPLRFLLWVPKKDALRFHRISPADSKETRKVLDDAAAWLRANGSLRGLFARPLVIDGSLRIQAYVNRTEMRAARRLFDAAADRFGLSWFDPERDETSLGLRFGHVEHAEDVTLVLDAVARGGEGWMMLEPVDGRGPFVEVGLDSGATSARTEVPDEAELGIALRKAQRAQLRLLGWGATETRGYRTELSLAEPGARKRAAEVMLRTLETVYGVAPGEPMALRFRTEDPDPSGLVA